MSAISIPDHSIAGPYQLSLRFDFSFVSHGTII